MEGSSEWKSIVTVTLFTNDKPICVRSYDLKKDTFFVFDVANQYIGQDEYFLPEARIVLGYCTCS